MQRKPSGLNLGRVLEPLLTWPTPDLPTTQTFIEQHLKFVVVERTWSLEANKAIHMTLH